jgi:hypothetical protein
MMYFLLSLLNLPPSNSNDIFFRFLSSLLFSALRHKATGELPTSASSSALGFLYTLHFSIYYPFVVVLNHAARLTPSTSILFLLYCAAASFLSIFHVSAEVLVAIVRQPVLSMLNTHCCIVLVSTILACG